MCTFRSSFSTDSSHLTYGQINFKSISQFHHTHIIEINKLIIVQLSYLPAWANPCLGNHLGIYTHTHTHWVELCPPTHIHVSTQSFDSAMLACTCKHYIIEIQPQEDIYPMSTTTVLSPLAVGVAGQV